MGTDCIYFILHHQTVVVPLSGIRAVFCFVTTIPGISPERIVQQAFQGKYSGGKLTYKNILYLCNVQQADHRKVMQGSLILYKRSWTPDIEIPS